MQQNVSFPLLNGVSQKSRIVIAVAVLALTVLVASFSVPPAQAGNTAQVYFVQGLPGRSVDIAVNGKVVAKDVAATKVVGPFTVTAGTPTVTIRETSGLIVEKRVKIAAGANIDIVVHWPADTAATPVLTWFANDLAAVPAGKASLTVAHTALVGPADIRVNGKVLFANIANGESLHLVVPAATYTVDIVPAGTNGPVVLGPAKLAIGAGTITRVFAIGDPKAKTMNVAVQVLGTPTKAASPVPTKVNTGTGGQAEALGLTVRR
jgi:hypothetical protein